MYCLGLVFRVCVSSEDWAFEEDWWKYMPAEFVNAPEVSWSNVVFILEFVHLGGVVRKTMTNHIPAR